MRHSRSSKTYARQTFIGNNYNFLVSFNINTRKEDKTHYISINLTKFHYKWSVYDKYIYGRTKIYSTTNLYLEHHKNQLTSIDVICLSRLLGCAEMR